MIADFLISIVISHCVIGAFTADDDDFEWKQRLKILMLLSIFTFFSKIIFVEFYVLILSIALFIWFIWCGEFKIMKKGIKQRIEELKKYLGGDDTVKKFKMFLFNSCIFCILLKSYLGGL